MTQNKNKSRMLWYNATRKTVSVQLNYPTKHTKHIVSPCSSYDLKCYFFSTKGKYVLKWIKISGYLCQILFHTPMRTSIWHSFDVQRGTSQTVFLGEVSGFYSPSRVFWSLSKFGQIIYFLLFILTETIDMY